MRRVFVCLVLLLACVAGAAGVVRAESEADATPGRGRIVLVLPFDNRTGQPNLEWIREGAAEILNSRLNSAGFSPMSRADRRYALDHLGMPQGFHPSRATALKLAETVDADSIVVGSYLTDGNGFLAEARVVDVPHLRMSEPLTARGAMPELIAVFNQLAWKLTRQLDPGFNVAQETFVAAGAGLRLDAFEQYIRGITEPDRAERLERLHKAVEMSPDFSQAWMALGREEYDSQQYDQAAAAFARVGRGDPDVLEAQFYRGLSLMFSGDYAVAETAFAELERVLPLAPVLNNQGVAMARRGKDGIPLFRLAISADPKAPDYHFNLAVSLNRRGDHAGALMEMNQCLQLRPNDVEAQDLQKAWKGLTPPPAPGDSADVKADPLERIARTFDEQAFKQAAQMLDEMDETRLAALTPHERAEKLALKAKDYLNRGLLLEAERHYLEAVAADGQVAQAHAGLAEVRERTGDSEAARREAQMALELSPSADAYLVLGRLDLVAGRVNEARNEADNALKLEPRNADATALWKQIEARSGQR